MPKVILGATHLSVREIEKKASVSHDTALNWVRHKIPSVKVLIRNHLWHYVKVEDLDDFLRERASSSPLQTNPKTREEDLAVKHALIHEGETFVSVREAARQADVKKTTIYTWIHGKVSLPAGCTLPAIRLRMLNGRGVYYVRQESLTEIIQRRLPIIIRHPTHFCVNAEVHLIVSHPDDPRRILLTHADGNRHGVISGPLKSGETLDQCTVRIACERRIVIDASWLKQVHFTYQNFNPGRFNFFYVIRFGKTPLGERWRILRSQESEEDMRWYPLDALPANIVPSVYDGISHYRGSYPRLVQIK